MSQTAAAPGAQPFIRRVIQLVPGESLVAECTLDLAEDWFLHDHTLGREIAVQDAGLRALSIVPLTVSMEVLAEAAAALRPDLVFVEMREVRAYRWILLEQDRLRLRITAQRVEAGATPAFHVRLHEADEPAASANTLPIIEGVMVMAGERPPAPQVAPLTLRDERPSRWQEAQVYREGMFHGPVFQAIRTVTRRGSDGSVATMQTPPLDGFLRGLPQPRFVAEPVLMDAAGQLIGLWTLENLESSFVVFPYRLERLTFYGAPFRPGEGATCQARTELLEGGRVTSDIDLIDEAGALRVRLLQWEDKRFHLSRRLYAFILRPGRNALSDSRSICLRGGEDDAEAVCRYIGDWARWESNFDFWGKVVAYGVLSPQERAEWQTLTGPELRRYEWLMGRIAAKEAVVELVRSRYGLALAPADVVIENDDQGAPHVRGGWLAELDRPVLVSIAHSAGQAMALAALGADGGLHGVGIDFEPASRRSQDFAEIAFTPEEQTLLAASSSADPSWPLRLWCAKEAVGKALGLGLPGPHSVAATALESGAGRVHLRLAGRLAAQRPDLADRDFTAATTVQDGLVVAAVGIGGLCEG